MGDDMTEDEDFEYELHVLNQLSAMEEKRARKRGANAPPNSKQDATHLEKWVTKTEESASQPTSTPATTMPMMPMMPTAEEPPTKKEWVERNMGRLNALGQRFFAFDNGGRISFRRKRRRRSRHTLDRYDFIQNDAGEPYVIIKWQTELYCMEYFYAYPEPIFEEDV